MATIRLKDGDFGADVEITVGSEDIYLPDPDHPGLKIAVPLGEVVEMDTIENDRSGQLNEAMNLAGDGFRQNGPAGLIMGMYAASKVKDVVFDVRLQDGRHFIAVADAKTYAELHSAQVNARAAAQITGTRGPADEIISRYLQAAAAQAAREVPAPAPAKPPTPVEPPARKTPAAPSFGKRRGGPTE